MSWTVVFLLVGFWVLGLVNGYSCGGLIHILLIYAGLMVIARLIEKCGANRETSINLNHEGKDDETISRFVD
ncbi:conserved hypothetical protein [Verrucomicrobia bacterium]|nr:conserved hypothetical protein [Verrucomicrobiota bacterium]